MSASVIYTTPVTALHGRHDDQRDRAGRAAIRSPRPAARRMHRDRCAAGHGLSGRIRPRPVGQARRAGRHGAAGGTRVRRCRSGALELEAVAEETGAALLPALFLSSAVLTVALVQCAGTDADKQRLLPGLADGTAIGTAAITGPAAPGPPRPSTSAPTRRNPDRDRLLCDLRTDRRCDPGRRARRRRAGRLQVAPTLPASSAPPRPFSIRPHRCPPTPSRPPRPGASVPPAGMRYSRRWI